MTEPSDALLDQLEEGNHLLRFMVNTDKTAKTKQTFDYLTNRLRLLEEYWQSFKTRHTTVCRENKALQTTHEYFTQLQYYEYEDAYLEAKSDLTTRLSAVAPEPSQTVSAGSTSIQLLPQYQKLSPLPLPKFNGVQRNWESFKEIICASVVDVPSMPKAHKLERLLSCLEGPAAARLAGISLTSSNFDAAWHILMTTYDNKRIRLSGHLQRILNMPMAQETAADIFRLLDTVEEAKRAMTDMQRPVASWDDWFVHLVESRLDPVTRKDWEKNIEGKDFPEYSLLKTFLEARCRTLTTAAPSDDCCSKVSEKSAGAVKKHSLTHTVQVQHQPPSPLTPPTASSQVADDREAKTKPPCPLCQGKHFIAYCPNFVNADCVKRWSLVEKAGLCFNCLRASHSTGDCPSSQRCRVDSCNAPHHSFLHSTKVSRPVSNTSAPANTQSVAHHAQVTTQKTTLLATARVVLHTATGETMLVRALLDPGSEVSFVSERVVQALHLAKRRSCTRISGVGGDAGAQTVGEVDLTVTSATTGTFKLHLTALVLPRITSLLPGRLVEHGEWAHIAGLELADPKYYVPGGVDCLLGADVYSLLLLDGVRKGGLTDPVAQNTVLGWVLTGPTTAAATSTTPLQCHVVRCHHAETSCCSLRDEIRRFWEIEEVDAKNPVSAEDQKCEAHFVRTHSRDQNGRFVLRLPFSQTPDFPGSLKIAKSRLLGGEKRCQRKPEERQAYVAFMKEYLDLDHMERVPADEVSSPSCYYIPHHAIFKSDGSGKIRVVFNASQAAENGCSLNDALHSGAKLQTDTPIIVTRWRFFRFVFSADIVKMFRQFKIHASDTNWLRIVWRDSPEEAIQHFRLTTVTYGTACAPFQAIRTLQQLAEDEREKFPLGAAFLRKHAYVDDIFAGADTIDEALEARAQLVGILRSAGMELDKWSANHDALLSALNDVTTQDRQLADDDVVSTLGLRWKPGADNFCFKVQSLAAEAPATKRGLLSTVARLYDPVGWLAPVLIRAKMLMQQLWLRGADWDQDLDGDLLAEWTSFHDQLFDIEAIQIPRSFGCGKQPQWYLHGFSDASEQAYAAALYLVARDKDDNWTSSLIIAKSRVAPLKTLSVPRLELCGAHLLARLIVYLVPQLLHPPARIFCWSDSEITLAWLRDHPSRWKVFVANRTSEIQTLLPNVPWTHVVSEENPADCASRGLSPNELKNFSLWWTGPDWLCKDWSSWEPAVDSFSSDLESRSPRPIVLHTAQATDGFNQSISRFSNLHRLTNTYAYVRRWRSFHLQPGTRTGVGLSAEEIRSALLLIIKETQAEFFPTELHSLRRREPLPRTSSIRRCLPFIDDQGIIRVGGRLQNFALSYEEKHPAIIPLDSHLTTLIIREAHQRTLHGGPQLVLSHIRRRFWIPQVRNKVRRLVRLCVRCIRFKGRVEEQQMAPLPAARGQQASPFSTCGVDLAGPFPVRTSKGRGQRSTKGYVCLFVCFSTRAVHLEVVSDLSTQMFLAAFRRFIGRRGLCHTIYSDNGTNLQGASAELRRLFDSASSFSKEVQDELAKDEIAWQFIPPRAPHFGGLWEAGVKSFKYHLKRVLGDATLTFEEFSTLGVQIEACLNSRPISPLSNNPEDVTALTPGHFLIGRALTALPEPGDFPAKLAGVPRYQLATVMRNHFWRRWQKEVIHQYQLRSKWLNENSKMAVGDLVLITDINLPATKWPLARVLQLHPGRDGLPRVATLKSASTTLDRPFAKLVRLPVDTGISPEDLPEFPTAGGSDDEDAEP